MGKSPEISSKKLLMQAFNLHSLNLKFPSTLFNLPDKYFRLNQLSFILTRFLYAGNSFCVSLFLARILCKIIFKISTNNADANFIFWRHQKFMGVKLLFKRRTVNKNLYILMIIVCLVFRLRNIR
jgi:hypothetical protein